MWEPANMQLNGWEVAGGKPQRKTGSQKAYGKPARNELSLLQQIHQNANLSRIDLAKRTGLSAACVGGIVSRLLKKGLIIEAGENSTPQGRRPVSLSLRHDLAYFVGVDLGSYMLRVVITDMLGRPAFKFETLSRVSEGRQNTLQRTFEAIHRALDECGVAGADQGNRHGPLGRGGW